MLSNFFPEVFLMDLSENSSSNSSNLLGTSQEMPPNDSSKYPIPGYFFSQRFRYSIRNPEFSYGNSEFFPETFSDITDWVSSEFPSGIASFIREFSRALFWNYTEVLSGVLQFFFHRFSQQFVQKLLQKLFLSIFQGTLT